MRAVVPGCQTAWTSLSWFEVSVSLSRDQPSFNRSSPPTTWQHSTLQSLLFLHMNHSTRLLSQDSVRKRMCLILFIFLPSVWGWTAAALFTLSSVRMQEPPQHSENIMLIKGEIKARSDQDWRLLLWVEVGELCPLVISLVCCELMSGSLEMMWKLLDGLWLILACVSCKYLNNTFIYVCFTFKIKHCELPVLPVSCSLQAFCAEEFPWIREVSTGLIPAGIPTEQQTPGLLSRNGM